MAPSATMLCHPLSAGCWPNKPDVGLVLVLVGCHHFDDNDDADGDRDDEGRQQVKDSGSFSYISTYYWTTSDYHHSFILTILRRSFFSILQSSVSSLFHFFLGRRGDTTSSFTCILNLPCVDLFKFCLFANAHAIISSSFHSFISLRCGTQI
jgi:hypothetical protein